MEPIENIFNPKYIHNWVLPGGTVVKNPPGNAGDTGHVCLIPGLERSPGGGNGNPLQYSCLENPMDRGLSYGLVGYGP